MQEAANKQKRITLKTLHEMLDGMSVELAEKVHLLFMANYIDYSDYDFRWRAIAGATETSLS